MSKDLNTGWVRVSRGLAGLQKKLQADTEEGKPQGGFQNCIPRAPQISKTPKSSKSQSSYISLKKQRKDGSAETSWGGSLSKKTEGSRPFPHVPTKVLSTWGGFRHLETFTSHRSQGWLWEAGCSNHITHSRNNRQEQEFLLKEEKTSLPATELSRNSCQSWTGGSSSQLCLA